MSRLHWVRAFLRTDPTQAGHSQASITERYIHAAQVLFPGAPERGEERLFSSVAGLPGPKPDQS